MDINIIRCLDKYMDANHLTELLAPEAAEILDKSNILRNYKDGLPLRRILRAGEYEPWAYQVGRRWHIRRSSNKW